MTEEVKVSDALKSVTMSQEDIKAAPYDIVWGSSIPHEALVEHCAKCETPMFIFFGCECGENIKSGRFSIME
jgi:hypothetical protein